MSFNNNNNSNNNINTVNDNIDEVNDNIDAVNNNIDAAKNTFNTNKKGINDTVDSVNSLKKSKFNLSTLTGVLNIILAAFSIPEEPLIPLPPPLLLIGAKLRPGISASSIASRIISRQSEAGRQVGDAFADGPNNEEAMELIRVEEMLNSLLTEAKVEIVIPPGVGVFTLGVGNLGAPVVSQGITTTIGIGEGVLR